MLSTLVLAACAGAARVDAPVTATSQPEAAPAAAGPVQIEPRRHAYSQQIVAEAPIRISNPYGDVRLRFGGYQPLVEISAVEQQPGGAAAMAFAPEWDGSTLRLSPRLPEGVSLAATQRLDIVVFVPKGHPVEVETERGLVEARGLQGSLRVRSFGGDLQLRGVTGLIDAETESGAIEASLENPGPGSVQRLQTRTGSIVLALREDIDAELQLATSAPIATEFSLEITPQKGQEPNKRGRVLLGKGQAKIQVESRRGEIRLLRRMEYTPVG